MRVLIIAGLLNLLALLLKLIFGLLPDLPQEEFLTNILTFFNNTICEGLSLFCIFIRPSTVITALPIVVAIFLFQHTYGLITWIVKKIPFLGVK